MASEAAASRILAKRRALGITQEELAAATGVTRQAIGAIESGRAQPGVALALAIARQLQTNAEALFGEARDEALRINAEGPLRLGQRVVVAEVGRRRIVRALDGAAGEACFPESAQGVVENFSGGVATVRMLQGAAPLERTVLVSGCEIALGLLVRHLDGRRTHGVWFPTSNRRAVADLAARRSHVAAVHGSKDELKRLASLDATSGTLGRLRRFELATTEAGWLVAKGNPLGLRGARDLARTRARLVNRPAGSAARTLLDAELRRASLEGRRLPGYERELAGQLDVARAIAQGFADAGLGSAPAAGVCRLDFIALRSESCVLLVPQAAVEHPGVAELLETLRSAAYRSDLEALGPYDARRIGEELRSSA
ncbi:MAG: substrate-binding domain-containing protein [Vulcanimicrobiaceae bacterium]